MTKIIHAAILFSAVFLASLGRVASAQWTHGGAGDFDNNGYDDILLRCSTGENTIVFMGKGGEISRAGILPLSVDWSIQGIADFDGDHHKDIFWRRTDGAFGIWFMKGSTVNAPAIPGSDSLGNDWQVGAIGNFDARDGCEILWRRVTTGENSIWFFKGATVTSTPGIDPLPLDWRIDGCGKINNDQTDDLVWRHSNGQIGIWFMDGTKVTAPPIAGLDTLGNDWQIAAVAQFDGVGGDEIYFRRTTTGENSLWYFDGARVLATPGTTPIGTTTLFQGVGDLNGDHRADVLYRAQDGTFLTMLSQGPKECVQARWDVAVTITASLVGLVTVPAGSVGWGAALPGAIQVLNGLGKVNIACGGFVPRNFGFPSPDQPGGSAGGGGASGGQAHESHDRPFGTSGRAPDSGNSGNHGQHSGFSISSGGVRLK